MKRLWVLPRDTHRVLIPLLSNTMPLEVSFFKRFCKFAKAGLVGPSRITGQIMRLVRGNAKSVFNQNCNFITNLYGIEFEHLEEFNFDRFFGSGWRLGVPDDLQQSAKTLRELLVLKAQGNVADGLSESDMDTLITEIATERSPA